MTEPIEAAAEAAYLRNRAGTTDWPDLSEQHKADWIAKVTPVIDAYNNSRRPAASGDLRERIARVINPQAFDEKYTMPKGRIREQQYALRRADAILAFLPSLDEEAIRKDERERCAEEANGVDPKLLEGKSEYFVSVYCASRVDAAAAIRKTERQS